MDHHGSDHHGTDHHAGEHFGLEHFGGEAMMLALLVGNPHVGSEFVLPQIGAQEQNSFHFGNHSAVEISSPALEGEESRPIEDTVKRKQFVLRGSCAIHIMLLSELQRLAQSFLLRGTLSDKTNWSDTTYADKFKGLSDGQWYEGATGYGTECAGEFTVDKTGLFGGRKRDGRMRTKIALYGLQVYYLERSISEVFVVAVATGLPEVKDNQPQYDEEGFQRAVSITRSMLDRLGNLLRASLPPSTT